MLTFDASYTRLPELLWSACPPTAVKAPELIAFNAELAASLGGEEPPDAATLATWFSGNQLPPGAEPVALAYAGHQFGNFVPQLGDGRAVLLGEAVDPQGRRRDVQLKGSGRTPYSRGGDGRAPLGPVLREYLVSEAMAAMGVPTTRALAAVTTGERVTRQLSEPGAVLTRVAASHIRVGSFQFAAVHQDHAALKALADYVIERHYPQLKGLDSPYLALFEAVLKRQAQLVAKWMGVGFIHGVMNTDNMSIAGETIDYGPCAFMEAFDPQKVYSAIDEGHRYAFSNQPVIAQWNLARFAECLLPLLDGDQDARIEQATAALRRFNATFDLEWARISADKLGLAEGSDQAEQMMAALQAQMQQGRMDMTATFDALTRYASQPGAENRDALLALTQTPEALAPWLDEWQGVQLASQDETRRQAMRQANPVVIPRNHRVEEAIQAGLEGDFAPFHAMLAVVTRPFDDTPQAREWAKPASEQDQVLRTFCGT